jgi:hypothetical protein
MGTPHATSIIPTWGFEKVVESTPDPIWAFEKPSAL